MVLSQLLLPVLTVVLGSGVSATPLPEDGAAAAADVESRSVIVKRSFLETCIGPASSPLTFTLTGGYILNGSCRNSNGNWQATSLDLNGCITNSDGFLRWLSNGVYKFSCPNAGLRHTYYDIDQAIDQVYLWADCYTASGTLRRSEIQLNDRIHNWDGSMACTP